MNINNQFQLFFKTSVVGLSWQPQLRGRPFFGFFYHLERKADFFLSESRYWLNGRDITIHDTEIEVEEIERNFSSVVDKIKSIAKAIFYFIPGALLKAFVWISDYSYVKQRNKYTLEKLNALSKEKADFTKNCEQPHLLITKKFTQEISQNNSPFNIIPQDLQFYILSFLNHRNLASFARTCKANYTLASNFSLLPSTQCRYYPNLIVEAMGKEKLSQLPFSTLDDNWLIFFKNSHEILDLLEKEQEGEASGLYIGEIELLLMTQTLNSNFEEQILSSMTNNSIQRIQFNDGNALVFQIKNNIDNKNYILIISKIKEKWTLVTPKLSAGLWLFLNDLHFHKEAPKVVDYLKRLFNGQPCGSFPENLNPNRIDYKTQKASEVLQEGPLLCPDGKTPVIQLWPSLI